MDRIDAGLLAGLRLKQLIKENYSTQEDFAYEYGVDIRTVNRYVNKGINKIDTIQELAYFFDVEFTYFFTKTNNSEDI